MHVPVLFACPACAMETPFALFLSFCIGGVLVSYLFLKPYVARVSMIWGWPRPNVARYVSLLPILVWPSLICWLGLKSHAIPRVAMCTIGLILCVLYLWLRGCWLLQQCDVVAWFRQVFFLSILGPAMLIVGFIVGHGIVVLLLVGLAWPSMAIQLFLIDVGVGAVPGVLLYGGLCYVFHGQDVAEHKTTPPTDVIGSQ